MMEAPERKLRVALLSYRGNMFCGGQGVYLVNMARALAERGHRVRIFSGPPYPDPVAGVEAVCLPDENFINRDASSLPAANPLEVFCPLNYLEYGLARAGANPEMLAFSLRCFRAIQRLHATDPLDVVHDNQGLGYGLLLVRALGLPVMATIHHPLQVDRAEDIRQLAGLVAKARRAIYYPPFMQKLVARQLDGVITVSEFSGRLVAKTYGLDSSRMGVVRNGVDAETFRPLAGVNREPGRLLFVGSTEDKKKGIVYLLEALARLPPRFKLVMVDGRRYPGRVYAERLVASLGLEERAVFRDRVSAEELIEEYNCAQMMVMPSLFEGFGLPALEAMACGTPLICTAAGGLAEVADAESAVVIKSRSAEAIVEAVLKLDGDAARQRRMGEAGRERARTKFTWSAAGAEVEQEYYRAIAARSKER